MSDSLTNPDSKLMRWCNKVVRTNPELGNLISLIKLSGEERNFSKLLPLYFRWEKKPVTLKNHYPFEVCYDMDMVEILTKMCGRQAGKSFNNSTQVMLELSMIDNFSTLYVMPFYEMVRRFSALYVSPLIAESPVKKMLIDRKRPNQVLQRSLPNGSNLLLAYAYNNADRVRGANTKKNYLDEVQLILLEVLDVIQRTMDGSTLGRYEVFSGTPTTLSGTLHVKWSESSQSEWVIPCRNRTCNHENIASVEYDLEKMIGDWRPDISPERPGIICASCREPIFTEDGHWQSRYPDKWDKHRGLHLPQVIMPWHCQSARRWQLMLEVLRDPLIPQYKVYNEVYGEPYDVGGGLLGEGDMKRASVLHIPYSLDHAVNYTRQNHTYRVLAIDWGGGRLRQLDRENAGPPPLSRTKIAVLGLSASGKLDVVWGWENPNPLDRIFETQMVLKFADRFGVHAIAYDTGNGGYFSEIIMRMQHQMDKEIARIAYGANLKQELIRRHAPNAETGEGAYYNLDKTRSLQFTAECIKLGQIRFFNPWSASGDESLQKQGQMLQKDFTNLTIETVDRVGSAAITMINKEPNTSDDFAHAVNFGANFMWLKFGYPNLLSILNEMLTPQDVAGFNELHVDPRVLAAVQETMEALSC